MTTQQHHAQFDWATELSDAQGHVTLSNQEAKEIGARLRSMGEKLKVYEALGDAADDMQLLRMGYAAARLDGRMRAAQPAAPQQEALRLAKYVARRKLAKQLDTNEIHGFDSGCDTEAVLLLSDIEAVLSQVAALTAAQPAPQADSQPALDEATAMNRTRELAESSRWPSDWVEAYRRGYSDRASRATAGSALEDAGRANWQDISTAPKDGTRFVAVGQNYGLDSEMQHVCIAQWFRGCWIESSDWNETSELKYLTHWMPLPPLPGNAASKKGGA